MLELRPNCEYCDVDLPAQSEDARICTYECTFCATCADEVLYNVCPNCGGGFVPRPIRPQTERRNGVSLGHQPASTRRVHLSHAHDEIAHFVAAHRAVPATER